MIIRECKPDGNTTRKLTPEELIEWANKGNPQAKKEVYKNSKKDTLEERVKAIEDLLL